MAGPHDQTNRIERDLETKGGKLAKDQKPDNPAKKHRSLDAVIATSGLLVVVAFAIVFGGRLNVTQRAALSGGVLGGAAGLLVGYVVGRIR
ncbi:MAG: hypothetical protein CL859_00545 [Cyanobium sp. ARS6]|uniref:hypothetical protein n=1 Tax=unclassified Synechococcus TaxID=2626047 RepID=UPI000C589CC6|nr:hypothetical protein [Cyanobium sp. ARS6]|tara:strand:- start:604 stop:876 length:273 start_codon:yes stop_codon:yes gene_type:complete